MSGLATFAALRLGEWTGLPPGLRADQLGAFGVRPDEPFVGWLGDPAREASWLAVDSDVYEGGLRVWLDDGEVVLVDGDDPIDSSGVPMRAPDLDPPDLRLDTVLDTLVLTGGELIYAARGLALRVNPANGLLLGARGFVPTTVEGYRARLRPVLEPRRRLAGRAP